MQGSSARLTANVDSATHTISRDSSTQAWRTSARALVLSPAASAFWRSSSALPNSSVRMLPTTFQAHQIGSEPSALCRVRMFCSGRSRLILRRLARLPQIAMRIAYGKVAASVRRKIFAPVCSTSRTVCGRAGGYRFCGIRQY